MLREVAELLLDGNIPQTASRAKWWIDQICNWMMQLGYVNQCVLQSPSISIADVLNERHQCTFDNPMVIYQVGVGA
jgi:hypothetical protein